MSKETYVIAKDGEGEELEVVKVHCSKCSAYEFVSPDEAKEINDENFQCKLCYNPKGVVKLVKNYVTCGTCGQTMGPDRTCWCPEENKPMLTWYDKSKDSTNKRLEEQIEESKLQGLERKIVRNTKKEKLDREIRTDENLQKLVELLLKKERKDAI